MQIFISFILAAFSLFDMQIKYIQESGKTFSNVKFLVLGIPISSKLDTLKNCQTIWSAV